MTRASVFVLMLLALCASGYTLVQKELALQRAREHQLIPGEEVARAELTAAGTAMAQAKSYIGTYARTNLPPSRRLKVVYATEDAFCLQVTQERNVFHLVGPGESPGRGPCSRRPPS